MRVALVLGVIGHLLVRFALAFVPPLLLSLVHFAMDRTEAWNVVAFAAAGAITFVLGWIAARWFREGSMFRRSEALGVVAGSWLAVALCGAVPYVFLGLSPIDAFFESMSGFTTTGATILTDFGAYDDAFFLWRGMTQWFGGLGVIALFIIVLPRLGIAGRQLFFAEASAAAGDAVSPQVRDGARRLWILYCALTAAQVLSLMLCGFGLFDGVVHALTTMSAGGFSPDPRSIEGFANPAAEWVFVVFMILSGTSFTLQYRAFTGKPRAFLQDLEFMTYLVVAVIFTIGAAMLLVGGLPTGWSLRTAAFQIVSLMSSTGYASADFELWSDGLKTVLILAMVVGGCAGSACGGPKVIRYLLSVQWLRREMTQVLHPRAVIPIRYGRMAVPMNIMRAVTTLVFLYIIGYAVIGATIVIMEEDVDLVMGFSAALACLGNIGPAFGDAGPMGTYASFSAPAKALLSFAMWIGRLEIVTVLALLHPHVWRHLGWTGADVGRVDASRGRANTP